MEDESLTAVMNPGYFSVGNAKVGQKIVERLHAFVQAAGLCRPVVHLQIDVGCPFASPPGPEAFVPDALQIRRLAAGTRCRDQQISAHLIEERHQSRLRYSGITRDLSIR